MTMVNSDLKGLRTKKRDVEKVNEMWVNLTDMVLNGIDMVNPFKPEFPTVIFIHYKPRTAVAILDFDL